MRKLVLIAVTVVGFVGGAVTAELRNRSTARLEWPLGEEKGPVVFCVRDKDALICVDYTDEDEFISDMEDLLDSMKLQRPYKGDL